MTSQIDETKPVYGNPTTESVRDNFATAKAEIELLQAGPALGIATPAINGGALVLDVAAAGVFRVNFNADITALSLANAVVGLVVTRQLELIADGNPHALNFGAWSIVTGPPVPTTALGRKDLYELRTDGVNVLVWLTAQNVPA